MVYEPLPLPFGIQASRSGLMGLAMQFGELPGHAELHADFLIPDDDDQFLRVVFRGFETFRVLDEMALSTEEANPSWEGHVPEHLAYRVQDGFFWRMQSEPLRLHHSELEHYQFVTGELCLEVLSAVSPAFEIVPR